MSSVKLNLVVAACANRGIGMNGSIPWRLKGDMSFFKTLTSESQNEGKMNAVIMGRKTFFSIPEKFRPLSNRINIILSKEMKEAPEGTVLCHSLDEALEALSSKEWVDKVEDLFIIGGSSIYQLALSSPHCHRIYLTTVMADFECDTFLPDFDISNYTTVSDSRVPVDVQTEKDISYKIEVYERKIPALPDFDICVAICNNRGIAKDNLLPWPPIRKDFEYYFTTVTSIPKKGQKNVLVHGRKCWEIARTIRRYDEHKDVLHVVVSNSVRRFEDDVLYAKSLSESLKIAGSLGNLLGTIWIMGGEGIYKEAVLMPQCRRIYLTRILHDFDADRFFPCFESDYELVTPPDVHEENNLKFQFEVWQRVERQTLKD